MLELIAQYWLHELVVLLFGAMCFVLKFFWKRQKAIEVGVRDMLRLTILDNYEHVKQDGKISVARKDAIDSAYNSYHALGGNGTITRVHEEIMAMPIY